MEKKRARRIRDKQRMKAKATFIYKTARGFNWESAQFVADNITTCSGPCCGNPRRWFGKPTMQERRFFAG